MLIEGRDAAACVADEPDVLIVGAGAVGLALGLTLARRGRRVTIVEAGGVAPRPDYEAENAGPSTGRPHRGLREGRLRALGGTTRLWGGQLVPFGPADFEGPKLEDAHAWPIPYSEYLVFVREAFAFLGVSGSGQDQEAIWKRAIGVGPEFGAFLRFGMNIWLPKPDFLQMFGKEIRELATLTVMTHVELVDLLFDAAGARVDAIVARTLDNTKVTLKANRIVLAAGTLEISRILLRTQALHPSCSFATNNNIGRWYIDHLHGDAANIVVKDKRQVSRLFDHLYFERRKYSLKVRLSDALRRQKPIANCAGFVNSSVSIGRNFADLRNLLSRIFRRGEGSRLLEALWQGVGMMRVLGPIVWRYVVSRRSTTIFARGASLAIEIEQLPTDRSYIFLDPKAPVETAAVGVHWDLDGREIDAAAEFCSDFKLEFERRGLGTVDIDPAIERRDVAFLASCHDSNHQMGGARMGLSAENAVVDKNLRVFGTANLYVAGAATFPSGSYANPTLTAIALALRLAGRLGSEATAVSC